MTRSNYPIKVYDLTVMFHNTKEAIFHVETTSLIFGQNNRHGLRILIEMYNDIHHKSFVKVDSNSNEMFADLSLKDLQIK